MLEVERMEVIGLDVRDIDKAKAFFGELFGIEFKELAIGANVSVKSNPAEAEDPQPLNAAGHRFAIDTSGYFELIQTTSATAKEGLRNMHFKVKDLAAAKAEMKHRGIRIIKDIEIGQFKEAVYHPDDLFGVRLCLIEYTSPTIAEAISSQ